MPSFILIRPTVWPQYTNVTDRHDRTGQDNGPISQGEPIYKRSPKTSNPSKLNQMWRLHFKYTSAESKSLPILGRCGLTIMPL